VSTDQELIKHVLNDMWHPKWREVIKFLAGLNGTPIIQAIMQRDNMIHAPLFLAAECWAETASHGQSLQDAINEQLADLASGVQFRLDAAVARAYVGGTEGLIQLLSDSDAEVRWAAAEALEAVGQRRRLGPALVGQIEVYLGDHRNEVREDAYRTLKLLY
jgi:hypothetical protein